MGSFALSACAPRRPEPTPPPPRPAPPGVAAPAEAGPPRLEAPSGATVFEIDPERSVVTLRVHRAGPIARLGHNHVIRSGAESGQAWVAEAPEQSGFDVRVTVADMVVDSPAARQEAGPDFAAVVPDEARDGTRRNLLRPEVLDAERYPVIAVQAASLGGTWDQPVAQADVWLKGQTRRIEVPLELQREAASLSARGSFRILQSDFGIVPFSVAGGAIQVADEVTIDFEIRAVKR
jgi:hypothetical protein